MHVVFLCNCCLLMLVLVLATQTISPSWLEVRAKLMYLVLRTEYHLSVDVLSVYSSFGFTEWVIIFIFTLLLSPNFMLEYILVRMCVCVRIYSYWCVVWGQYWIDGMLSGCMHCWFLFRSLTYSLQFTTQVPNSLALCSIQETVSKPLRRRRTNINN